ncbi:chemotaxis protein CheA [Desulfuromonas sp. AOP6]|uniref:chemotaxis protein CheA n=1 Tax=Desulfuromonas sp. AOP6 TaxID=1566351 RepID=UPI001281B23F|nr:chemotaxis protein CheA [Desulfuromonas sp. AOP6]BCA80021.1 chemotaxis protein CheA [Desulfuromonas sp. AOP6]
MSGNSSSRAIKDFLAEAEEIIEKLSIDLMALGEGNDGRDTDPDLLNSIFRSAHSIKGLAGMFGFDDISSLSHAMENLLDHLRLGKVSLSPLLVETLFEGLDLLLRLVNGKGTSESFTLDGAPMQARIAALLNAPPPQADDPIRALPLDPAVLNVLTEYEEHRLRDNLEKGRHILLVKVAFALASFDQELGEISDVLKSNGEIVSTLPCAGDFADKIAFQILVATSLSHAEIKEKLDRPDAVVEIVKDSSEAAVRPSTAITVPPASPPVASPPGKLDVIKETLSESDGGGASLRSISRTVRVDIDKLDYLMNIVGELVLSKGAVAMLCDQLKAQNNALAGDLQKVTRVLERRLHDLQKGVMDVRMVPVSQLFEKVIRIIRRVANEQGKKVEVDIRGADTELDKLIVEDLSDPLMHIIRNAVDHGIESPEERRAAGKPEKARIYLWASQKGNHVVLEIRDDGRGIDPERVRKKALEKGMISAEAELSRDDIFNLILAPGFSTRDEVTDLSGRGVGMDVVRNNIAALSGMLELDSTFGQGTAVTITLPITLAIIKALVIKVSGKAYAIPINSVMETLLVETASIRTIERLEVIDLREHTLPLVRLSRLFRLPTAEGSPSKLFVVVVGLADKKMGIVVDDLLGQQDVVIKSLGSTLSFVRGIAGAADLGNQKTVLVLDVGGLMSESLRGDSSFYV